MYDVRSQTTSDSSPEHDSMDLSMSLSNSSRRSSNARDDLSAYRRDESMGRDDSRPSSSRSQGIFKFSPPPPHGHGAPSSPNATPHARSSSTSGNGFILHHPRYAHPSHPSHPSTQSHYAGSHVLQRPNTSGGTPGVLSMGLNTALGLGVGPGAGGFAGLGQGMQTPGINSANARELGFGMQTPGTREGELKELKDFWKEYMRTPLTGPTPGATGEGGFSLGGNSGNNATTTTAAPGNPNSNPNPGASAVGGAGGNGNGAGTALYKRSRVSSLPSVYTPTSETRFQSHSANPPNNNINHSSINPSNAQANARAPQLPYANLHATSHLHISSPPGRWRTCRIAPVVREVLRQGRGQAEAERAERRHKGRNVVGRGRCWRRSHDNQGLGPEGGWGLTMMLGDWVMRRLA